MSNCLVAAAEAANKLGRPVRLIEIGTAWGAELFRLSGSAVAALTSVDVMYDWVPDVQPDVPFDPLLVDQAKVDAWHANSSSMLPGVDCALIIGKSWDVADDPRHEARLRGADVLVIDGCHHPPDAVEQDYWAFERHMADEHAVVFDDLNHGDPNIAFESVRARLGDAVYEEHRTHAVGVLYVRRQR